MEGLAVLSKLQNLGFRLGRDGERLRVVPKSKLTPELRQLITENKNQLLEVIKPESIEQLAAHPKFKVPVRVGWYIAWRDSNWRMRGGTEEEAAGLVREVRLTRTGWIFTVANGKEIKGRHVKSVGRTNDAGEVVDSWRVWEHGLDGSRACVRATDQLERFFAEKIIPQLSALHQDGHLPNLAQDPFWIEVESAWRNAAKGSALCNVEGVKKAMLQAVESYANKGGGGE